MKVAFAFVKARGIKEKLHRKLFFSGFKSQYIAHLPPKKNTLTTPRRKLTKDEIEPPTNKKCQILF